jgi:hypothetical protein
MPRQRPNRAAPSPIVAEPAHYQRRQQPAVNSAPIQVACINRASRRRQVPLKMAPRATAALIPGRFVPPHPRAVWEAVGEYGLCRAAERVRIRSANYCMRQTHPRAAPQRHPAPASAPRHLLLPPVRAAGTVPATHRPARCTRHHSRPGEPPLAPIEKPAGTSCRNPASSLSIFPAAGAGLFTAAMGAVRLSRPISSGVNVKCVVPGLL